MSDIQFGPLYFPTDEDYGPLDLAQKAEEWGYDYYWIPDYVTLPYLDAFVLAAAVASKTTKLRIGTAVTLAPFRTPLQFAKSSASVDVISDGRFTLGIGVGGVDRDFEVTEVDFHQRGRITDETIDITRRLLDEEKVSYEGRYFQFKDLTIGPRPVQPHLPIWIGASGSEGLAEGTLRRTAKYGDGFFPTETSQAEFKRVQPRIREMAASHGRDPDSIGWGLLTWLCFGDNVEQANRTTNKEIGARLGTEWDARPENGYALGTARNMIDTIEGYVELGLTNFVIDPGCAPAEILSQLEAFAKEVIPHFRGSG